MTAAGACAVELLPPDVLLELPPMEPLLPPAPLEAPKAPVPELPVSVGPVLAFTREPPAPPSASETGEKQQEPKATLAIAAIESLRMTHYRAKIQPRTRLAPP